MFEPSSDCLIRNGQLEANIWRLYLQEAAQPSLPPDETGWMVSLPQWQTHLGALALRRHPIGIVLPTDSEPDDLMLDVDALQQRHDVAFLAVHFPQYSDGRGYSLAWMLREEYGWRGELRAIGDVLIDTMHYLARCGFNSFLTKPGHDPEQALQSLHAFTHHYQTGYASVP